MSDLIDRADVLETFSELYDVFEDNKAIHKKLNKVYDKLRALPSVQPFHNTTMNEVLEYIDDMSEDEWQEFTACLECRGWKLQWCGGDFE